MRRVPRPGARPWSASVRRSSLHSEASTPERSEARVRHPQPRMPDGGTVNADVRRRARRRAPAPPCVAQHQVAAAAHASRRQHRLERRRRRHRLPQRHRVAERGRLRPADRGARLPVAPGREPARFGRELAAAGQPRQRRHRCRAGLRRRRSTALDAQPEALTPEQEAELAAYFADDFGPELAEASGEPADGPAFLPESAGRALPLVPLHAVAEFDGRSPSSLVDAGDGSAWSAAHADPPSRTCAEWPTC